MARTKSLEDMTPQEIIAYTTAIERSSNLLDASLNNPATRKEQLALLKKVHPNMPIPEIDSANELETRLAAERDERKKLEDRIRDGEIRDRLERERKRCMSTYELTEADMIEVEKIMTDKDAPIPHYDAACKVFKASRTAATPTPSAIVASRTFDMPTRDVWGKGVGNKAMLDKTAMEQAVIALNEIRGNKAA
jgi:hypothetical protein